MLYKNNTIVVGVKILSRTFYKSEVRRNTPKGFSITQETMAKYNTVNIDCGCTKTYTHIYLRSLDTKGRNVKCPIHTRNNAAREEARMRNAKQAEVNQTIPKSDADLMVAPKTNCVGFIWGKQGHDDKFFYQVMVENEY